MKKRLIHWPGMKGIVALLSFAVARIRMTTGSVGRDVVPPERFGVVERCSALPPWNSMPCRIGF